jgi:flagellar biosynthetic protein FlhB
MPIDHDERTEPATPRRRQEARQKGQVARSADLSAALLLLAGFVALRYAGPGLWNLLVSIMATALTPQQPTDIGELRVFCEAMLLELAIRLGPLLLILVAVVLLTLIVQVG